MRLMQEESAGPGRSNTRPSAQQQSESDLAVGAVVDSNNDLPSAAELFLERLQAEAPQTYQQRRREALMLWAIERVGEARRRLRDRIIHEVAPRNPDRGAQILQASAIRWFNWPILPGLMLRDATRSELTEASERYLQDADTFIRRGQWLQAIAELLPDEDTTVSQALSEDDIAKAASKFGVSKL